MLQNKHFSTEEGLVGPFNTNAIRFEDGTITGAQDELRDLGCALIEALGNNSSSDRGKWSVTVVTLSDVLNKIADFYTEGRVSLVFDNTFEWILSSEEAWVLATDFVEERAVDVVDKAEMTRLQNVFAEGNTARSMDIHDAEFMQIKQELANEVLVVCDVEDLVYHRNGTIRDVLKSHSKHFGDLSEELEMAISAWLEKRGVTTGDWWEHYVEVALDQSIDEAKRNRAAMQSRVVRFESIESLCHRLEAYLGLPCSITKNGDKQTIICHSPNGRTLNEFSIQGHPGSWNLGGPSNGAMKTVKSFRNSMKEERRRLSPTYS